MRPYDMITRFDKPCTIDEAKELTAIYLNNFFNEIKKALSNNQ